jgi:hypothetical protein
MQEMPINKEFLDGVGDPGRIRTCDLQLRRLLLYPLSYGAMRRHAYTQSRLKILRQIET